MGLTAAALLAAAGHAAQLDVSETSSGADLSAMVDITQTDGVANGYTFAVTNATGADQPGGNVPTGFGLFGDPLKVLSVDSARFAGVDGPKNVAQTDRNASF